MVHARTAQPIPKLMQTEKAVLLLNALADKNFWRVETVKIAHHSHQPQLTESHAVQPSAHQVLSFYKMVNAKSAQTIPKLHLMEDLVHLIHAIRDKF